MARENWTGKITLLRSGGGLPSDVNWYGRLCLANKIIRI